MISTVQCPPSAACPQVHKLTPDEARLIRQRVHRFPEISREFELNRLKVRLDALASQYNYEPSPEARQRLARMHIQCFKAIARLEFPEVKK